MIKKYLEYINERLLTQEDLEDNLLRLKEVYNCYILFDEDKDEPIIINGKAIIPTRILIISPNINGQEIYEELITSVRRLKNFYPDKIFNISEKFGENTEMGLYDNIFPKYGIYDDYFGSIIFKDGTKIDICSYSFYEIVIY